MLLNSAERRVVCVYNERWAQWTFYIVFFSGPFLCKYHWDSSVEEEEGLRTMFVWRMHSVSPANVDLKCKCSKAFTLVAVRHSFLQSGILRSADVAFLFFVLDCEASSSDFISFIRPSFDFVLKVKFYMWQTDKGEKQRAIEQKNKVFSLVCAGKEGRVDKPKSAGKLGNDVQSFSLYQTSLSNIHFFNNFIVERLGSIYNKWSRQIHSGETN